MKSQSTSNARNSLDVSIPTSRANSVAGTELKLLETQTFDRIMISQEVRVDVLDLGVGSYGEEVIMD